MILIKTIPYNTPSYQAIYEFETSFKNIEIINEFSDKSIIKKIFNFILRKNIIKSFSKNNSTESIFIILMNINDLYKIIPIYLKNRNISLYIYDLLEFQYSTFFKIINYLEIKNIFFSSKDTTNYFNSNYKSDTKFYWLAEAIKLDEYSFKDYSEKNIDIISFGRKYDIYHNKILKGNFNYIYNRFPNHKDLIDNLSRTKISICFPSNITHNELFKNISKVTMRYIQSMLCKCLILGKAPNDIKYLFNYNPIIEADLENPIKQIEDILSNYNKYIDLIETNYNEVIRNHKYTDRIDIINNLI